MRPSSYGWPMVGSWRRQYTKASYKLKQPTTLNHMENASCHWLVAYVGSAPISRCQIIIGVFNLCRFVRGKWFVFDAKAIFRQLMLNLHYSRWQTSTPLFKFAPKIGKRPCRVNWQAYDTVALSLSAWLSTREGFEFNINSISGSVAFSNQLWT